MSATPLAQYLSEFDERHAAKAAFEPARSATRTRQPVFEHLSLVSDRDAESNDFTGFGSFGAGDDDEDATPGGFDPDAFLANLGTDGDDEAEGGSFGFQLPAPDLDIESVREKAFQEGRDWQRREMEAEFQATLAEERSKAAAALAEAVDAARREWSSAEGARLAERFGEGLVALEKSIRGSISDVLRPLATGARQQQTVGQLVDAVRTMTLDGQAFRIVASGPTDMLADFADRLGEKRELVTFEPQEQDGEIRIAADKTVIETRLSAWRRAVEEALS
ncbi:hypothetical protein [Mangrovicella endophytica]|uniref:hypothetical protein n=1 Tax=Mangrovicella endophytica TaxID=2066697 RepID=UPI000C9EBD7B|nr:hypothetical protein [Mangrovicella endophytica]